MRGARLLLLAAPALAGCDGAAPADAPADGSAVRFVDESAERGVDFVHRPHRTSERWMAEVLGSGVALADFDRDGAPDLYLVGGGDLTAAERPADARDRLYLNDGTGRFRDASDAWGVRGAGYGMGVAAGDIDGDGWTDLFLTGFRGEERLLRNTGAGFEDVTEAAGLVSDGRWSTSAGFLDVEGDGDLDLFVVRYVDYELESALPCWHGGRHIYCSPALYDALPDRLWLNRGDGTFVDASAASGIAAHPGKGLALVLGDIDGDGDTDAYVVNDISRNLLWINAGDGTFAELGRVAGVAYDETGREAAGMGGDLSDVDGDGRLDIACTNFQGETTNLYLQERPLVFRDRSYPLGVGAHARASLGFGVDFFDADGDGDEDLAVANGHIDDGIDAVAEDVSFAQRDHLYLLGPDGRFEEVSERAGPGFATRAVTRGLVSGDLDGDLRLDLVLTDNGGGARLLLNRGGEPGGAALLWLEGAPPRRSPLGARVEADVAGRTLLREVRGASSYLSSGETRVHLGLRGADAFDAVRVRWPGGRVQELGALGPGHWRVVEGEAPLAYVPGERVWPPSAVSAPAGR